MAKSLSIVLCHCVNAEFLPEQVTGRVYHALAAAGVAFEEVADLCGLAARKDPVLRRLASAEEVRIAACFPRAVKWLFAAAGAPLGDNARILNMRTAPADEIAAALLAGARADPPGGQTKGTIAPEGTDDWVPWFPVIDYDRCTGCMQCMNFCIFGVYAAADEGKLEVRNPANCKINCPACARICPAGAVIFPKYADGGPIAGDDAPASPGGGADLADKLRGDMYAVLRSRRGDGDSGLAERERLRCICVARREGELKIPLAVLKRLRPEDKAALGLCDCQCDYSWSGEDVPACAAPDRAAAACCPPAAAGTEPCCGPATDKPADGEDRGE